MGQNFLSLVNQAQARVDNLNQNRVNVEQQLGEINTDIGVANDELDQCRADLASAESALANFEVPETLDEPDRASFITTRTEIGEDGNEVQVEDFDQASFDAEMAEYNASVTAHNEAVAQREQLEADVTTAQGQVDNTQGNCDRLEQTRQTTEGEQAAIIDDLAEAEQELQTAQAEAEAEAQAQAEAEAQAQAEAELEARLRSGEAVVGEDGTETSAKFDKESGRILTREISRPDGSQTTVVYNEDGSSTEYMQKGDQFFSARYDSEGNTILTLQNGDSYSRLQKFGEQGQSLKDFIAESKELNNNQRLIVGKDFVVEGRIEPDDPRLQGRKDAESAKADYAKFAAEQEKAKAKELDTNTQYLANALAKSYVESGHDALNIDASDCNGVMQGTSAGKVVEEKLDARLYHALDEMEADLNGTGRQGNKHDGFVRAEEFQQYRNGEVTVQDLKKFETQLESLAGMDPKSDEYATAYTEALGKWMQFDKTEQAVNNQLGFSKTAGESKIPGVIIMTAVDALTGGRISTAEAIGQLVVGNEISGGDAAFLAESVNGKFMETVVNAANVESNSFLNASKVGGNVIGVAGAAYSGYEKLSAALDQATNASPEVREATTQMLHRSRSRFNAYLAQVRARQARPAGQG